MKHYAGILSISLVFFTGFFIPQVTAEEGISLPVLRQASETSVLVTWQTSRPSSSQVLYASALTGEFATSVYASNSVVHEVLVAQLIPGGTYTFTVKSVDSDGIELTSLPVSFAIAEGHKTTGEETEALPPPIEQKSEPEVLRDIQGFIDARSGSLVFLLTAYLLAGLLFLVEETTWLLALDWMIGMIGLSLGRKRQQRYMLRVYDALTDRPLHGAEVSIMVQKALAKHGVTNYRGEFPLSWHTTESTDIRISKPGYEAVMLPFTGESMDIVLRPTGSYDEHVFPWNQRLHHLKHSLRVGHMASLILGTLLLLFLVAERPTALVMLTFLGYALAWLGYARMRPRHYQLTRIVDMVTGYPIAHALVLGHTTHRTKRWITDRSGYLKLAYPLPESLTIRKYNYQPLVRRPISASSMSSDILEIGIDPAKEAYVSRL